MDVVLRLPLSFVGLEAGYGHFFGGRYLTESGFGAGSADFFYLQTLVGFQVQEPYDGADSWRVGWAPSGGRRATLRSRWEFR